MSETPEEQKAIVKIVEKDLFKYVFHPKANYIIVAMIANFKEPILRNILKAIAPRLNELAVH